MLSHSEPSKVYFLSYAHIEFSTENVDRFVTDLNRYITQILGESRTIEDGPGFRDSWKIQAGTNWENALSVAIRKYRIGIVLLSPDYLSVDRPRCKWEFDYLEKATQGNGDFSRASTDEVTRTLLVINWINCPNYPTDFPTKLQMVGEGVLGGKRSELLADVRYVITEGLSNVLDKVSNNNQRAIDAYTSFMQSFAGFVVDQFQKLTEKTSNVLSEPPKVSDPLNTLYSSPQFHESLCRIEVPRHERVDFVDGAGLGQVAQHMAKPCVGFMPVGFGGFNE
jgi:TIR domain